MRATKRQRSPIEAVIDTMRVAGKVIAERRRELTAQIDVLVAERDALDRAVMEALGLPKGEENHYMSTRPWRRKVDRTRRCARDGTPFRAQRSGNLCMSCRKRLNRRRKGAAR